MRKPTELQIRPENNTIRVRSFSFTRLTETALRLRDYLSLLLLALRRKTYSLVLRMPLGDILNTLGVEDITRIDKIQWRLHEPVDGALLSHTTVKIVAHSFWGGLPKTNGVALPIIKIAFLGDSLEGFVELRLEQLFKLAWIVGTNTPQSPIHLKHGLGRGSYISQKIDGEVCADIVLADDALFADAAQSDPSGGEIDEFGGMDDRVHQSAAEMHGGAAHAAANQCITFGNPVKHSHRSRLREKRGWHANRLPLLVRGLSDDEGSAGLQWSVEWVPQFKHTSIAG